MVHEPKTQLTDDEARDAAATTAFLCTQLNHVVMGQDAAIASLVTGLLADGHVLLEGVPGVAKTLLARALAASLGLSFARVQFTPDLMPTDLLGTRVWDPESRVWEISRGPVFTDVLLADEVNRTPPKTQAALLEAMAERQVTLDGTRHDLGAAFFVIATENPLEFEGTYPLPEAQTDRFLLKVIMSYPDEASEFALLSTGNQSVQARLESVAPVLTRESLMSLRQQVERVHVEESVRHYIVNLLRATRSTEVLKLGASPRAGLMLQSAARANALRLGRAFVLPEDVKDVALGVLRHRLALSTEAELDGMNIEDALTLILDRVALRG